MVRDELLFVLGGPQGAGLETSAQILTFALAHLGYGVLSDREYFSNIKGRHSYVHTRVSSKEFPLALTYPVQLLGCMDAETLFTHYKDLEDGGYLIYDTSTNEKSFTVIPSMEKELKRRLMKEIDELGIGDKVKDFVEYLRDVRGVKVVELNYPSILGEFRKRYKISPSQVSRYISAILVGAITGLMGLDAEAVSFAVERRFGGKETLVEHNKYLIKHVAELVEENFGKPLRLAEPKLDVEEVLVVTGNDVTAMGKMVGGLRYQSYYPITPAADESFFIESKERLNIDGSEVGSIIVFQTEDELAAIASAIGAALTGARSATATSGPGFSLMVEALGWAGLNEVPVVITYYQRGGPSTGLPTRGSQSDLLFTLFASHGEFPRIVLSSGDHLEAFYDAIDAFNYAEKYQLPVIHLLDKFVANSFANIPIPNFEEIRIDRGEIVEGDLNYKRFDLSKPISPRAFLGSKAVMWYTGDEHDELGHITEDPENRVRMYDKRMKKLELADKEIPPEKRAIYYGDRDAEYLLVGWGFAKGVSLDAIKRLEREGIKGAYLHLKMFEPFPSKHVLDILKRFDENKVIAVEHNYYGQAASLIRMKTGFTIRKYILKFTGRPIYTHELVDGIKKIFDGVDRVVLKYGA